MQPGSYDLVGHVVYEVDGKVHKNVFHNGTIDVVEAGFFLKGETIFLSTLGLGLLGFLGMWAYSKVQEFIKVVGRIHICTVSVMSAWITLFAVNCTFILVRTMLVMQFVGVLWRGRCCSRNSE